MKEYYLEYDSLLRIMSTAGHGRYEIMYLFISYRLSDAFALFLIQNNTSKILVYSKVLCIKRYYISLLNI